MTLVDEFARKQAAEKFGLPLCLHLPIAARDETAIHSHVGHVVDVLASGTPPMALLIETTMQVEIDSTLPIWQLSEALVLHRSPQVWVHVDFAGYRCVYAKAFPMEDIRHLVLDHVMNRRVARLKDFKYLRLLPVSREANSSSGGLSEKWAVEYQGSVEMRAKHLASPARVQHADLADIVKMLNRKTGGSLQDPVNEAQALVRAPKR
ncbi:MAG: hypothetical protein ACYC9L_10850 [Sulfuricaulis sp.]